MVYVYSVFIRVKRFYYFDAINPIAVVTFRAKCYLHEKKDLKFAARAAKLVVD